jgi:MFS superfamily sulfate permease-like transporter
MMVWGLARGAGSITASIFKAAATLFAVCIVLGLVAVALPYAIGFAVLIAAVVLVVVLVQRHKQQGPAAEDPGSQNAPRAAKDEVRLFAACPSCGARYQFAFRRGCTETVCQCNACGKSFKVESSGAVWPLS